MTETAAAAMTDDRRILFGVPVDVEQGPTPGAVAHLRAELREAAKHLTSTANRIEDLEHGLAASRSEQLIWRTSCDELIEAIVRLEKVGR